MLKPNLKYLKFDDRKMILLGVPLINLLIPFIFYGINLTTYLQHFPQEFFDGLLFTATYAVFIRYLIITMRKRYEQEKNPLKRLIAQFIALVIVVPPIMFFTGTILSIIYRFTPLEDIFEPTRIQSYSVTYFTLLSLMSVYEAIYFFHEYKNAIVEKEQLQKAHIQSQLDNLRNQINPHFLFNSMNTLMNLIPVDAERAMNYLSKLSKFYRYTVSNQEQSLVPLEQELKNVDLYADLLKERFHKGIEITLPKSIPNNQEILPLCLQLLIENAVKHNIVATKNPLKIKLELIDNEQYIQVSNNIQQKIQAVESTGMGLKNIKSRVAFFSKLPVIVSANNEVFQVAIPLIKSNT